MAKTKQVQRKNVQSTTKVTNAEVAVQNLPLPNGIKEEVLYALWYVTRLKRTIETSFELDR